MQTGKTSCQLTWNSGFGQRRTDEFNRKQMIVDSEVLRHCSPLVPFRTSMLEKSGTRFQYYQTAQSRIYDPRRGAKWFERMKPFHMEDILRAAEKG